MKDAGPIIHRHWANEPMRPTIHASKQAKQAQQRSRFLRKKLNRQGNTHPEGLLVKRSLLFEEKINAPAR